MKKNKEKIFNADTMKRITDKNIHNKLISELQKNIEDAANNGHYTLLLKSGLDTKDRDQLYDLYDSYIVDYFEALGFKFMFLVESFHNESDRKIIDTYRLVISWK